jgi:hypothetical protein
MLSVLLVLVGTAAFFFMTTRGTLLFQVIVATKAA